jgi:hypothetical protein
MNLLDNEIDPCTLNNVLREETLGINCEDLTLERRVGVDVDVFDLEEVCTIAAFLDGCWGGGKVERVVDGGGRGKAECAGQGDDD